MSTHSCFVYKYVSAEKTIWINCSFGYFNLEVTTGKTLADVLKNYSVFGVYDTSAARDNTEMYGCPKIKLDQGA